MKKEIVRIHNRGFTLIEVLVTVVVIGVLAAVVIPAVTSQVTAGDSSRVIADLNNIRTGVENFDIGVRSFPGDIDDLVNKPGQTVSATASSTPGSQGSDVDADITGSLYLTTALAAWAGPYIEASLPTAATSSSQPNPVTDAYKTGYNGTINNRLLTCSIGSQNACSTTSGDYVVVQLDNLTIAQTNTLNSLIDGSSESSSSTSGKFRESTSGTTITAYYFATPFK